MEAQKQIFIEYSSLQEKYVKDIQKVQDEANQKCK